MSSLLLSAYAFVWIKIKQKTIAKKCSGKVNILLKSIFDVYLNIDLLPSII